MEYQKIINLLVNTPNQPNKFRTKNWVKVNDDSRGTYNINSQIKFKTSMLRSSLSNYSDAQKLYTCIETITVTQVPASPPAGNAVKEVVFKICPPFTDCMSEINNA